MNIPQTNKVLSFTNNQRVNIATPIFEIKFQQVISCACGLYMSRPLANYLMILYSPNP